MFINEEEKLEENWRMLEKKKKSLFLATSYCNSSLNGDHQMSSGAIGQLFCPSTLGNKNCGRDALQMDGEDCREAHEIIVLSQCCFRLLGSSN